MFEARGQGFWHLLHKRKDQSSLSHAKKKKKKSQQSREMEHGRALSAPCTGGCWPQLWSLPEAGREHTVCCTTGALSVTPPSPSFFSWRLRSLCGAISWGTGDGAQGFVVSYICSPLDFLFLFGTGGQT